MVLSFPFENADAAVPFTRLNPLAGAPTVERVASGARHGRATQSHDRLVQRSEGVIAFPGGDAGPPRAEEIRAFRRRRTRQWRVARFRRAFRPDRAATLRVPDQRS